MTWQTDFKAATADQRRSKQRIKEREHRWRRAHALRAEMSDDDRRAEEARLVQKAAELAEAKGLNADGIGRRWNKRGLQIDLHSDGVDSEGAAV
ncbi:hypothetical protein [Cribrihabitans neustonicus]|uniref:hypothetical protein n=1 Tax=Cribrihabitans neustonicus TaxID=1429085 RepID=UPI003B591DF8